jgi:cell division protein FtsQ
VAKSENKTRHLVWEDDPPAEPRFRRAQPAVPVSGRGLPGMPVEMKDEDDSNSVRSKPRRFNDEPIRPWWRPATTFGRVLLGTGLVAAFCAVAFAGYTLKHFLEHDMRFSIAGTSNIEAKGLAQVSRAEMLPVFGEDIGRNIFFVPLTERRKQLEQIPWIEHASVMRLLPDQIRISVVERKPIAFVRIGSHVDLIDINGVVLTQPPAMMAQHHYSFPVVTGIGSGDPVTARRARMEVYQRLIADLDSSGQHLSDQISEIDLRDPEDARVLMPEQGADILAHFGEDHFLERYQRYKAHIAEWRQQYPKLAEVDLRYEQQVVLQMTDGARSSPADKLQEPAITDDVSKPSPAKLETKTEIEKAEQPKHVQTTKTSSTHTAKSSTQSAKAKSTHSKTTAKKHETKHTTKKTPTKSHTTTTTGA